MDEIPLIADITIIFALSIGVLLLCHKLKIPTIVGFLITGVLSGPHGFGFIADIVDVQTLANVGIVLLLFTVGMEFSIKKLLEYKRFLLIGGFLQVFLTTAAGFLAAYLMKRPLGESVFLGFLISLSSTAIVMRMLEERGESASPHGKIILSILVLQDIIVVPMVLLTPILSGEVAQFDGGLLFAAAKGVLILLIVFLSAELIVPQLLHYIAKTRSRELFLLGVLTICLAVAWITSSAGLSLSLGAFLAGLIVSESEYSHEAIGDIIPFQDIFTSFFFVSMGMLLDIDFLLDHPILVTVTTLLVIFIKTAIVIGITILLGMPLRTAIMAGLALGQIGEFSFVVAKTGIDYHIATDYHYQLFLAISLMTMSLTPTLIALSPKLAGYLATLPLPPILKFGLNPIQQEGKSGLADHVIIIGMGMCGKSLSRATREASIPYTILDMNPERIHLERQRGEPIHFGDATHDAVLKHANISTAKVVVVAINDPLASLRIVKRVRKANPSVYLVVKTSLIEEVKMMYKSGADDVIPDEFGTSIEIFSRVLKKYNVSQEEISQYISDQRSENYEILRLLYREPTLFSEINANSYDIVTESFKVEKFSPLVGKSVLHANLRRDYHVTILMINREGKVISNPSSSESIRAGDLLILMGSSNDLAAAAHLFHSSSIGRK